MPALGLGTARADPTTFYFGAGITHVNVRNFGAEFNPELPSEFSDVSGTSGKALAGLRPLHWFAIEADITPTVTTNGSEAQTFGGYGVFLMGTENFDLFLKAGINAYTLTATGIGVGPESGLAFGLGAGLQWRFGHVGLRFEYEALPSLGSTNGLQAASLEVMLFLP